MVTEPMVGLSTVTIGPWSATIRNGEDVPFRLLRLFQSGIQNGYPAEDCFQEEDDHLLSLALQGPNEVNIRVTRGSCEVTNLTLRVSVHDLAGELARDIQAHLEPWVDWLSWLPYGSFMTQGEVGAKSALLSGRCDALIGLSRLRDIH